MKRSFFACITFVLISAVCLGPNLASARFLQTDPIGYEDQMNLYAYVGNDPVNVTDPTGLRCCADDTRPERDQASTTAEANMQACEENPNACDIAAAGAVTALTVADGVPGDELAAARAAQIAEQNAAIRGRIGELQRSVRSLEKRAADHEKRAAEFRAEPTVRPGMEGQSAERIAVQQEVRAAKLERDAAEFRRQADEARQEIERLEGEIR